MISNFIIQAPARLFSVLASAFFGSPAIERPDVKAATATRETRTAIEICRIRFMRFISG
jgi:hypothetical protein